MLFPWQMSTAWKVLPLRLGPRAFRGLFQNVNLQETPNEQTYCCADLRSLCHGCVRRIARWRGHGCCFQACRNCSSSITSNSSACCKGRDEGRIEAGQGRCVSFCIKRRQGCRPRRQEGKSGCGSQSKGRRCACCQEIIPTAVVKMPAPCGHFFGRRLFFKPFASSI
jgi:hypothetical protein